MNYLEFNFEIDPVEPGRSILLAYLAECGFESFVEVDHGLKAYILESDFNQAAFEAMPAWDIPDTTFNYERKEIAPRNWNAEWESGFQPVKINDICIVRAPFHPNYDVAYEITIAPNMSFGTGHHETTQMMLQWVLKTDVKDKSVLDMGCGTGVIAILASLRGASEIFAIDNDPICVDNAKENANVNGCDRIVVLEGGAEALEKLPAADLIFANINRNILLEDIPKYVRILNPGGALFLSGFYEKDLEAINAVCERHGLRLEKNTRIGKWVSPKYVF